MEIHAGAEHGGMRVAQLGGERPIEGGVRGAPQPPSEKREQQRRRGAEEA